MDINIDNNEGLWKALKDCESYLELFLGDPPGLDTNSIKSIVKLLNKIQDIIAIASKAKNAILDSPQIEKIRSWRIS